MIGGFQVGAFQPAFQQVLSVTTDRPAGGWTRRPWWDRVRTPSDEEIRRERERFGVIPKAAKKAIRKVIERKADEAAAVETESEARELLESLKRETLDRELRSAMRAEQTRWNTVYSSIAQALIRDEIRRVIERREAERLEEIEVNELLAIWMQM